MSDSSLRWKVWYAADGHKHRALETERMRGRRKDPKFCQQERDALRSRMRRRRAKGKMTPEQRSEIARKNALKRWAA